MTAAALENDLALEPHMKGPLTLSAALHVVIVIVAIIGLPYLKPELPMMEDMVTVELVDVSDLSSAKPPEQKVERRQPPQQTKDEPPKPVTPSQMTAETPPKPVAPKPPEPEAKKDPAPPEKALAPPEKKAEPLKAVAPPPPEKRPVLTQSTEAQEEEFKSLLRNLMPSEPVAEQADTPKEGEKTMLTRFSEQMSMSEMDGLKRQLTQCWSVLAGARYAEDMVVDIKLSMNPNRTIQRAQIENQLRYAADSHFRAAADSALRAVNKCSPLDLPPDKYDLWKDITVTFDPRSML